MPNSLAGPQQFQLKQFDQEFWVPFIVQQSLFEESWEMFCTPCLVGDMMSSSVEVPGRVLLLWSILPWAFCPSWWARCQYKVTQFWSHCRTGCHSHFQQTSWPPIPDATLWYYTKICRIVTISIAVALCLRFWALLPSVLVTRRSRSQGEKHQRRIWISRMLRQTTTLVLVMVMKNEWMNDSHFRNGKQTTMRYDDGRCGQ